MATLISRRRSRQFSSLKWFRQGQPVYLLALGAVFISVWSVTAWRINYAPDIFLDEFLYYQASHNVAAFNQFSWHNDPIFIHPPGFFLGSSVFLKLLAVGNQTDIFTGIYTARLFNCGVAAITAVLLFDLSRRLRNLETAVLVWGLFLLDPFVLRINRRNMLESMAEMLAVAGLYYFWLNRNRFDLVHQLITGLIFGMALLTKELAIFSYLALPLYAMLCLNRKLLWQTVRVGAVAMLCWSLFPLWAWSIGQWNYFLTDKTYTIRRFIGEVQITGWNRPGVSFIGALQVNLAQYATSYLLILLGVACTTILGWGMAWRMLNRWWLWLWFKLKPGTAAVAKTSLPITPIEESRIFVVAWAVALYAYIAFSVARGALEDQFFYLLMLPVLLIIAYGLNLVFNKAIGGPGPKKWLLAGAGGLLLLGTFSYNLYSWQNLFGKGQDNSLYQVTSYIKEHVPTGNKVNSPFSIDEPTFQAMLPDYKVLDSRDPNQIQQQGIHYIVVSSKQLWGKYSNMSDDYYDWVKRNGQELFKVYGNTFWEVGLYYLDYSDVESKQRNN